MHPEATPIGKLRIITPDGNPHDLDIAEGRFGRDGFEFQCIDECGKKIPIASGDVAVTRFKGDRCHFKIFQKDDRMYIKDMGSGNGTFIDGQCLPGFVSGKGSNSFLLPEKCRLKVGQREMGLQILSTAKEQERKRKRTKAHECMESRNYKAAQRLFIDIGEYALAREAKDLGAKEKLERILRERAGESARNVVFVNGDVHGEVSIEDKREDLRGLDAKAIREKSKWNYRTEMIKQDGKTKRSVVGRDKAIDKFEFESLGKDSMVHDDVINRFFKECSCCGNFITPDNKKVRCKNCLTYYCETCERWIKKMTEYRGIELRIEYPLCEKCYGESVFKKKQQIDGK